MDSAALVAAVESAVPGAGLETAGSRDAHLTVYAPAERLPEIARALRDHPALRFGFLAELTAVDYHPRDPRFEEIGRAHV